MGFQVAKGVLGLGSRQMTGGLCSRLKEGENREVRRPLRH